VDQEAAVVEAVAPAVQGKTGKMVAVDMAD